MVAPSISLGLMLVYVIVIPLCLCSHKAGAKTYYRMDILGDQIELLNQCVVVKALAGSWASAGVWWLDRPRLLAGSWASAGGHELLSAYR